jgi:hypothetical protein
MLTARLGCRGDGVSALVVSVAALIPSLEPRLQFEQAQTGDRSGDDKTCHHKWSHLDLLWSLAGRRVGLLAP